MSIDSPKQGFLSSKNLYCAGWVLCQVGETTSMGYQTCSNLRRRRRGRRGKKVNSLDMYCVKYCVKYTQSKKHPRAGGKLISTISDTLEGG